MPDYSPLLLTSRYYELGYNVCITKPVEYDRCCEALRELGMFLQLVRVPHEAK